MYSRLIDRVLRHFYMLVIEIIMKHIRMRI
nr:MAG TPA: hypothetical protein [Caudoviricetes sp.]